MDKPPEDSNRYDPLGVFGPMASAMPEMWSKAVTDLAGAEASAEASARAFDSYLTMTASAHKLLTQFMGQILGQLNLPTQGEVISLAERLTNIEMRLDDLDAQLGQMAHNLEAIASALTSGSGDTDSTAPLIPKSTGKDGNRRRQAASTSTTGTSTKGATQRHARVARE